MIDPKDCTACLITTLPEYPPEVLATVKDAGFADILIYTECPSIAGRLSLFEQAQTPLLFTMDDDALCPFEFLFSNASRDQLTTVMHPGHIEFYRDRRHCLMNWGAVIPRSLPRAISVYTELYGMDSLFKREFDRIFTGLNFPQLRLPYPVINLPRSANPDRVSMDPKHWEYMAIAEDRLDQILKTDF